MWSTMFHAVIVTPIINAGNTSIDVSFAPGRRVEMNHVVIASGGTVHGWLDQTVAWDPSSHALKMAFGDDVGA